MDEAVTTLRLRQNYAKLSVAEQEAFNQNEMNLKQLLSLDSDHVYTIKDLENLMHLTRGLQLCFRHVLSRHRLSFVSLPSSTTINYLSAWPRRFRKKCN
jgi:hypothetical protein